MDKSNVQGKKKELQDCRMMKDQTRVDKHTYTHRQTQADKLRTTTTPAAYIIIIFPSISDKQDKALRSSRADVKKNKKQKEIHKSSCVHSCSLTVCDISWPSES